MIVVAVKIETRQCPTTCTHLTPLAAHSIL
jgi:hypothetical protein